jgi:molecular chaperone GrpE
MADKDYEIPVKVVDRRWWANQAQQGGAATAAPSSLKPTYVEELERQIADKDKQIQEYIAKYRQASSEFETARLRMRREIAKDVERGRREIVADLLEVLDNLDRAVDATRAGASFDALLQGVELVRRQFASKLESLGVERIESDGQPFDPQLHEAVSAVATADPSEDGRIVGVVRQGYRMHGDVLRPAAVAVAKLRNEEVTRG